MKYDFYIDETNSDFGPVVRWVSSNNIPFLDKLTEFLVAGLIDQDTVINSMNARKVEDKVFLEQYVAMRQTRGYSDEEKTEMRNAFGDQEVFDIFTGKAINL